MPAAATILPAVGDKVGLTCRSCLEKKRRPATTGIGTVASIVNDSCCPSTDDLPCEVESFEIDGAAIDGVSLLTSVHREKAVTCRGAVEESDVGPIGKFPYRTIQRENAVRCGGIVGEEHRALSAIGPVPRVDDKDRIAGAREIGECHIAAIRKPLQTLRSVDGEAGISRSGVAVERNLASACFVAGERTLGDDGGSASSGGVMKVDVAARGCARPCAENSEDRAIAGAGCIYEFDCPPARTYRGSNG